MKISTRERDGITFVDLSGKLEGGEDNLYLLEVVSGLGKTHKLDVVVNFSHVPWISSTGLGILVRARARLAEHGGIMRLCNLNERSLNLLVITKVKLIFEVFDTEAAAIAAVASQG
jgi:anti-sigma B factor antagonist